MIQEHFRVMNIYIFHIKRALIGSGREYHKKICNSGKAFDVCWTFFSISFGINNCYPTFLHERHDEITKNIFKDAAFIILPFIYRAEMRESWYPDGVGSHYESGMRKVSGYSYCWIVLPWKFHVWCESLVWVYQLELTYLSFEL